MAKSYAIIHIDSHNPMGYIYDTPKIQLRYFAYAGAFASSVFDEQEIPDEILCKFMKNITYKEGMHHNYYTSMVRNHKNGEILWKEIDKIKLADYYRQIYKKKYPAMDIQ